MGARLRYPPQLFLALLSVVLSPIAHATADDWPRWMGAQDDGVWRETGILDRFPESGADIVWRKPLGAGYAGPSVAAGHVFVMARTSDDGQGIETENNIKDKGAIQGGEQIACFDLRTGEQVWSHEYDCPYKIAYPTGPRCTPAVDGSHVYTLGAMGDLKCLATDSGNVVWEKKLTTEYGTQPPLWGYASHPRIDGGAVIVPVGGRGSGLVAFDKLTGQELWQSVTTKDIGYAPVVIYEPADPDAERQLIFWHGEGVTAVNPADGSEFWNVKFPEKANASVVTIATPVLSGNRLLIAEFYKGALLLEIGSHPPAVTEVWRNFKKNPKLDDAMNAMMATPVVKDGLAYGVAYGVAYTKRGHGVLRCIDVLTGDVVWTDANWMGGDKPLMFATGFITPNKDKDFLFNDLGELMICRMSPAGFEELDRAKILEPTSVARGRAVVWSHPAFSSGMMVVRNDKELVCVNLKKPASAD